MKNLFILSIFIFLLSCGSKPERPDSTLPPGATTDITPAAAPPTAEPPQNAAGVWHFTCPNGCAGGAGAKQPCAKCGTELAHNQAYHDGAATTSTTTTSTSGGAAGAPQITPITSPTTTAEPPQNAAGVWHFTCPKGCAGGAGAKQPCAKCGTELAHNQAYHN